ncbi:MAG: amidohydrolase family protein [Acidobacteriota bacterium]|nr:amidohydrolase family protein [Acidobacteriota bacterium]
MSDASSAPGAPRPGTLEWLAQVVEEPIDPDRPIIDPHHHLWRESRAGHPYLVDDLWADTESGHNIEKTVFLECGASYRDDGPEHMKVIGETEFVAEQAALSAADDSKATIAAIVSRADLSLGDAVEEVLHAHEEAGNGLFRGIRHSIARDPHPEALSIPGRAPEGLATDPGFRAGLKRLGDLGYTYDVWLYHHQLLDFAAVAAAVPTTTMVLDHFGTPLGVGPYDGKREEIFEQWKPDIVEVARNENVVAKLGGLAMPDNGFGWNSRSTPATSDELVAAQAPYYIHTIECFGPERGMMESNFPVDRRSISYTVMWNGLKKIVTDFSEDESQAMFYDTAARVYRI